MLPTLLSPSQLDVVESVSERCDSCGAAARLAFELMSGGELAFCGHHANRHAGEILRVAGRIRLEDGFAWSGAAASAG